MSDKQLDYNSMLMTFMVACMFGIVVNALTSPVLLQDETRNTFLLYHGTPIDYHKLLKEGIIPISRDKVIHDALTEVKSILGYIPLGSQAIAEESYKAYRRRHHIGTYLTNSKNVAMFYAGLGCRDFSRAGGETFLGIVNDIFRTSGHYDKLITSRRMYESYPVKRTLYVLTIRMPANQLINEYAGASSKEDMLSKLMKGEHVPEVRTKEIIPAGNIIEVEEFVNTSPCYIKSEGGYRQVGVESNSELRTIWKGNE